MAASERDAEATRPSAHDETIAQIVAEFSQVFAFARGRWASYAEQVHADLSGAGMMMLHLIARHGPITAKELTCRLRMDKAFVSRQLTSMRALGLVEAEPSVEDRRITLLTASEQARATLDELHRLRVDDYSERFEGWSDEDLSELLRLLHRFNEAG